MSLVAANDDDFLTPLSTEGHSTYNKSIPAGGFSQDKVETASNSSKDSFSNLHYYANNQAESNDNNTNWNRESNNQESTRSNSNNRSNSSLPPKSLSEPSFLLPYKDENFPSQSTYPSPPSTTRSTSKPSRSRLSFGALKDTGEYNNYNLEKSSPNRTSSSSSLGQNDSVDKYEEIFNNGQFFQNETNNKGYSASSAHNFSDPNHPSTPLNSTLLNSLENNTSNPIIHDTDNYSTRNFGGNNNNNQNSYNNSNQQQQQDLPSLAQLTGATQVAIPTLGNLTLEEVEAIHVARLNQTSLAKAVYNYAIQQQAQMAQQPAAAAAPSYSPSSYAYSGPTNLSTLNLDNLDGNSSGIQYLAPSHSLQEFRDSTGLTGRRTPTLGLSPSARAFQANPAAISSPRDSSRKISSSITATITPSNYSQQLTVNPARTTQQLQMDRLSARARTCVVAFHRVLSYCEQEKIIPRESVLKKRLLDSKLPMSDIDFEDFLQIVHDSNLCVIEGEPPQRVIWPRSNAGEARKFACADFFQPTQRLSKEQTDELLAFLHKYKPEVDRGRFGFAQYLARHGPPSIQLLPHGVLVELVQLLLNQKILLFRKGKVSVAPLPTESANPNVSLLGLGLGLGNSAFDSALSSNLTSPFTSQPSTPNANSSNNNSLGAFSMWPSGYNSTGGANSSTGSSAATPKSLLSGLQYGTLNMNWDTSNQISGGLSSHKSFENDPAVNPSLISNTPNNNRSMSNSNNNSNSNTNNNGSASCSSDYFYRQVSSNTQALNSAAETAVSVTSLLDQPSSNNAAAGGFERTVPIRAQSDQGLNRPRHSSLPDLGLSHGAGNEFHSLFARKASMSNSYDNLAYPQSFTPHNASSSSNSSSSLRNFNFQPS
jgi:hypothetical protein